MFHIVLLLVFLFFIPVFAEEKDLKLEEIVVEGKKISREKNAISLSPETLPAIVSTLTRDELDYLITPNHEEIFKKIPGVYVENYGQGDIGSALTMRGLGGGGGGKRYVTVYVDGIPQNYPLYFGDHIISWIIPEMIERIDVIKGPFSVFCGDNTVGGCINIKTLDSTTSTINGSGGSYGSLRFVPLFSYDKSAIKPLILGEYYKTDGYRDNSEYERYNFFAKLSYPIGDNKISFKFNYYKADWNAPGYISLTELKNHIVNRKSTLTPDDGGDSEILSMDINYAPKNKEEGLYFIAYYNDIELNRYVAFPVYSTSAVRQHARIFNTKNFGIRTYYNFYISDKISLTPGFEFRYDDGYYQRFPTSMRNKIGNYTQYWDAIYKQYSLFFQAQVTPFEILKIILGTRFDKFDYNIKNQVVLSNSGEGDSSIVSPKVGFVLSPMKNFNIFANWSQGARAPYVNELSPASSTQSKNFNLEPAKVSSWDIGFNTTLFNKFQLTVDYYQTDLKREVLIVNNEPVNIGESKRDGIEIETKLFVLPEISLYGSYSLVSAKVKNPQNKGQDKVIDVPKNILKLGVEFSKEFRKDEKFYGDLSYYYISGKYYYIGTSETPIRGPFFDRYTLNLNYRMKKFNYFFSTIYTPQKYSSEITWLNGNEIMVNPQPQWNFIFGLKYEL
mgnify:CR=1 FL=1